MNRMHKEKKVPAIRFEGFSGEWEEMVFSEIASRETSGSAISGLPRVEFEDIISGKGELNKDIWTKESSKKGIKFNKFDVLFGKLRPYLKNWLFPKFEGIAVGDFWVLRAKRSDSKFVYYLIHTFSFYQVANLSSGSKMPRSDWGLVSQTDFNIPVNITEQTKIGNYFQQLDTLIAQHQKKHDKLLNLKKSLLEKLFPKKNDELGMLNAESVTKDNSSLSTHHSSFNLPEIRFKGFSGEWEEKALGDDAEFSKGQGYSKSDLVAEGNPIVLYGRLYTQYQTVINEVDTFAIVNNKSIFSRGNEVVVPASGETAEDISRASAVLQSGVLLGGDLNIIYPSKNIDSIFLALTLSNGKPQKDLSKRAQGKSVVHLRNNDLIEVEISYPDIKEQTKIGSLFKQLDTLITQHQAQLKKINNIKQACLEKMFV